LHAAVLKGEFTYALISAIAGLSKAELGAHLDRLVAEDVLFVRGDPPDATYSFKYQIMEDAAYDLLSKSERRRRHGLIVDVLIADPPNEAATGALARHAACAGRIPDAIEFYRRAGERSQARFQHEEAIRHFRSAIQLLGEDGSSKSPDPLELKLQLQ